MYPLTDPGKHPSDTIVLASGSRVPERHYVYGDFWVTLVAKAAPRQPWAGNSVPTQRNTEILCITTFHCKVVPCEKIVATLTSSFRLTAANCFGTFQPPPSCLVSIGPADGVIALLTVFFKESSSLIVACNGVSSFLPIVARFHCLNLGFNLV